MCLGVCTRSVLLGVPLPQEALQAWGPGHIAQGSTKVLDPVPTYPSPAGREQRGRAGQQVQVGVRVTVLCASPLFPSLPPSFLCSRRVGAAPPKSGGRGDGRVFFKALRPSLAQLLQKGRGHS